MNRSRPPRRCASTTGSAPRADTMAGQAESSLRSSTAPTQDYVFAHLKIPSSQTGFICNRAQAVKELTEAIATELEE